MHPSPEEFSEVIHALDMDDSQKTWLRYRWLDQLCWWENRAKRARWMYYALQSTVVVGGVCSSALAGLQAPPYITSSVAALVAISAGLAGLFHYGEVWRQKRRAAELLKIEGWQFFQLSSADYAGKTHNEAYPIFADRIERLIRGEIKDYIAAVQQKSDESPNHT